MCQTIPVSSVDVCIGGVLFSPHHSEPQLVVGPLFVLSYSGLTTFQRPFRPLAFLPTHWFLALACVQDGLGSSAFPQSTCSVSCSLKSISEPIALCGIT